MVNVTNSSMSSSLTLEPSAEASVVSSSSGGSLQSANCGSAVSDASKVLSRGLGLSKAYVGQKSSFSVDCSQAGESCCPPKM